MMTTDQLGLAAPEYLQEDHISLKLSMIAILPWFGAELLYVFGCDGHADCETSASYVACLNDVFRYSSSTHNQKIVPREVVIQYPWL